MRRAALALCLLAHEAAAASDALTRVDGVLATLMARMRAPEPSDRPNFTEALADLAAPPEEAGVALRVRRRRQRLARGVHHGTAAAERVAGADVCAEFRSLIN